MSIYCQQCGTENEDGAKFCKSCGAGLNNEPKKEVTNSNATNNTFDSIKKVFIWGGAFVVLFILGAILITFIQEKNEEKRIENLRSECTNDNAQACYELAMGTHDPDEYYEVLAKGCQLGNKDACRAGGYYEEGCRLQDGESCYLFASKIQSLLGIEGSVACGTNQESRECALAKNSDISDVKEFYQLSCQYGHSQGCMQQ